MPLTFAQLTAIGRSVHRYGGAVSQSLLDELVDELKRSVESLIQPEDIIREPGQAPVQTGLNPATARARLMRFVEQNDISELLDSGRIDFALTTARDVSNGAGVYAAEAADEEVVEAYPAWELLRIYDRDVPRGFRRGPQGALYPVPGDDWPTRFQRAAEASGDTDAARILQATGRMIALKASPIWQALGNGEGGYTDTLKNPYAPFAFNSGYDLNNVGRVECVELGLLRPGQRPPVADVNLEQLFAPLSRAA
jgi:hypothetical protein